MPRRWSRVHFPDRETMSQSEAKAAELTRYFSGRRCKNGHLAERFTSTRTCVVCSKEQNKTRRNTLEGKAKRRIEGRKRYADPAKRKTDNQVRTRYRNNNKVRLRDRAREWEANRLKNDVQFKLRKLLRIRLISALKARRARKIISSVKLLGCSVQELKTHIEAQFTRGMTWANWGTYWHLDHIRPLSTFDLTDPAQAAEACHFLNLRPLRASKNLQKKDKRLLLL